MKTLQLTQKELNLILEALNWADNTMRDYDYATDRKADAMVALKEKIEHAEFKQAQVDVWGTYTGK
jgi:hypothetical protein